MSIDELTDLPPTSEEDNEIKEEHILGKVAILKQEAQEQAAHDTKIKQMKRRWYTREVCTQKLKIAHDKARAALTPTPGLKPKDKISPAPTDNTSDYPTDEETALEAEVREKKLAAKQDAEVHAEKLDTIVSLLHLMELVSRMTIDVRNTSRPLRIGFDSDVLRTTGMTPNFI